jgi:hypothetical protein
MISRNRHFFLSTVLVVIIYSLVSFSFLENYINGDQIAYHKFYNLIKDVPFSDVGPIALSTLSSAEPITWFAVWVGSNLGIDKNIWISFLNVLLIVGLYVMLLKYKVPWFVVACMLTNFYVIVLMTGAERLKIAYILLTWGFVVQGRSRFILVMLTPLAHLQSFILLTSALFAYFTGQVRRAFSSARLSKKTIFLIFTSFVLSGVLFIYLQDGVIRKFKSYSRHDISPVELSNIGLLFVIGLLVTRDKLRVILALLPLVVAVALLGAQRVNMIAVTIFIGLLMFERRLSHPLVLLLLTYFSMKSVLFIYNIYNYGDGFAGPLW